jgi:hypothetical protein
MALVGNIHGAVGETGGTGAAGGTGGTGGAGATGETGPTGADGNHWLVGAVDPTTEGVNGDFYLNSTSGDIFEKVGGSWGV